jgi:hypothetical protein
MLHATLLLLLRSCRKLGHLSWLSACAVIGFAYTSALVLYEGLSTATKRPEVRITQHFNPLTQCRHGRWVPDWPRAGL